MSVFSGSLYSPELATDHPVTITLNLDSTDSNPRIESVTAPLDDEVVAPKIRGDATRVLVPVQKHIEGYDIAWPATPKAVFYRLYGSVSPDRMSNLLQDEIKDTEATFYPPLFIESVTYFFWVAAVFKDGREEYLSDQPASLAKTMEGKAYGPGSLTCSSAYTASDELACEMKKIIGQVIRPLNRLQLEVNGEEAVLFLRRSASDKPWGRACSCTDQRDGDDEDPDLIGSGRCLHCFGTGIFGGFYPGIPIMFRYGNAPKQVIKYTKRGQEVYTTFNTYMLWTPRIRKGDLIVRRKDGMRFIADNVAGDISVGGIELHQEFDLNQIEKTDILMYVTDKAIDAAVKKSGMPSYMRDGFKIFG
jgi:hypothetical protein